MSASRVIKLAIGTLAGYAVSVVIQRAYNSRELWMPLVLDKLSELAELGDIALASMRAYHDPEAALAELASDDELDQLIARASNGDGQAIQDLASIIMQGMPFTVHDTKTSPVRQHGRRVDLSHDPMTMTGVDHHGEPKPDSAAETPIAEDLATNAADTYGDGYALLAERAGIDHDDFYQDVTLGKLFAGHPDAGEY